MSDQSNTDEQLRTLQEENASLRQQISEPDLRAFEQVRDLRATNKKLAEETKRVTAEFIQQGFKSRQLETELKATQGKLETAHQQIQSLRDQLDGTSKQLDEVRSHEQRLGQSLEELQTQLSQDRLSHEAELERQRTELAGRQQAMTQLQSELGQREQRIGNLEKLVNDLKVQYLSGEMSAIEMEESEEDEQNGAAYQIVVRHLEALLGVPGRTIVEQVYGLCQASPQSADLTVLEGVFDALQDTGAMLVKGTDGEHRFAEVLGQAWSEVQTSLGADPSARSAAAAPTSGEAAPSRLEMAAPVESAASGHLETAAANHLEAAPSPQGLPAAAPTEPAVITAAEPQAAQPPAPAPEPSAVAESAPSAAQPAASSSEPHATPPTPAELGEIANAHDTAALQELVLEEQEIASETIDPQIESAVAPRISLGDTEVPAEVAAPAVGDATAAEAAPTVEVATPAVEVATPAVEVTAPAVEVAAPAIEPAHLAVEPLSLQPAVEAAPAEPEAGVSAEPLPELDEPLPEEELGEDAASAEKIGMIRLGVQSIAHDREGAVQILQDALELEVWVEEQAEAELALARLLAGHDDIADHLLEAMPWLDITDLISLLPKAAEKCQPLAPVCNLLVAVADQPRKKAQEGEGAAGLGHRPATRDLIAKIGTDDEESLVEILLDQVVPRSGVQLPVPSPSFLQRRELSAPAAFVGTLRQALRQVDYTMFDFQQLEVLSYDGPDQFLVDASLEPNVTLLFHKDVETMIPEDLRFLVFRRLVQMYRRHTTLAQMAESFTDDARLALVRATVALSDEEGKDIGAKLRADLETLSAGAPDFKARAIGLLRSSYEATQLETFLDLSDWLYDSKLLQRRLDPVADQFAAKVVGLTNATFSTIRDSLGGKSELIGELEEKGIRPLFEQHPELASSRLRVQRLWAGPLGDRLS